MKKEFISELTKSHLNVQQNQLTQGKAEQFISKLLAVLFPHLAVQHLQNQAEVESQIEALNEELCQILLPYCEKNMAENCKKVADSFFADLENIYSILLADCDAIVRMDPAAKSHDEVITCYPGFYAIAIHRMAHWFCKNNVPLMPRILAEYAHKQTGIDIHPGAQIGKSFAIDHGTGIVIGETTIIEENVQIYQGVTLGGLVVDKSLESAKRHPTVEKNTVIYANATILGGKTVIGHDSVIGGNVWLTSSVPPHSKVYHQGEVKTISKAS